MSSVDALGGGATDRLTRRGLAVMKVGIRRQWVFFTLSVVLSALYGVMQVADAWVLGWVTDHVVAPSFEQGEFLAASVWAGVALFLGAAVLRTIGVVGRRLLGGIVYYRLVRDDRRRVTRKYLQLPLRWHHRHPTGQLLSNANADVEATWAVFMPLPMAIGVLAMLGTALVTMFVSDVVLTLIALVVFPLLFGLNAVYQAWVGPRVAHAQSLRGDVSSVAHESFDGALVVKSLGREADETARFATVNARLRDANIRVGRLRAVFDPLIEALPNIGVLLVILVGAQRVASGDTAPGDVVEIAFLFTAISHPIRALGWVLGELPRSVVGWNRVQSVLRERETMHYGPAIVPGGGAVRVQVEHLAHRHPDIAEADGDQDVLADVSFTIEPGKVTALVGSTGSGKSTLATLVTRLTDARAGRIAYDDVDVMSLSHDALSSTVALVPQTTFVFDDSVRDNITLGLDLPDEEIWQVLRDVQADGFVRALPQGIDSPLGERGTSLSGGQRQRIALARALVRNPRFLVLDDATSALDPQVEQRILGALSRRSGEGTGPTILVVAYRKATIALADEVILLENGRITERGTDAELRVRSVAYTNIVDAYDRAAEEVVDD